MNIPMVKLNDGTSVPLDEFVTWSRAKQNQKTTPLIETIERRRLNLKNSKLSAKTPFGRFTSVASASEHTKISERILRERLNSNSCPEYSYVKPKSSDIKSQKPNPKENINSKKTVTPLGTFVSRQEAAKAHGVTINNMITLMLRNSKEFYFANTGPKPNTPKRKRTTFKPRQVKVKLTPEERNAINIKKAAFLKRKVKTPVGIFDSMSEASEKLGYTQGRLLALIHNTAYPEYDYADQRYIKKDKLHHTPLKQPINNNELRLIVTPIGKFTVLRDAQRAFGITYPTLIKLTEHFPKKFYFEYQKFNNNSDLRYLAKSGVITSKGHFLSIRNAALAHNLTLTEFKKLLDTKPEIFYLVKNKIKN